MLLSDLVSKLELDVPAEDGVPSTTQYENAIKDAIADFSERCGMEQIGTLNIVSGTATYDLPTDFLRVIKLQSFAGQDVLYAGDGKLIPVPAGWCERFTVRNGKMTFFPTPTYTMAKQLRYKAAWIGTAVEPEGSGDTEDIDYATLSEREARIVLLKARSLASQKKVNAQAGTTLKYSFGAVSEDLGGSTEALNKDVKSFEADYIDACAQYNGSYATY